jgi:hypothetical protein
MINYSLNRPAPLDGSKILKDIDKLISTIPHNDRANTVLNITLQKVTDYASDSLLPKIEYKTEDCST